MSLLAIALALCWFVPVPLVGLGALALAALSGLTFPDVDQFVPLLRHRSALTHSLLVVLLCMADRRLHPVAAGLALGIGFHLAADCFPASMRGFATVKVPLAGTFDTQGSYMWLAINAVAGSYVFGMLVERLYDPQVQIIALVGALLLGATYLAGVPGGYRALAVYAAIFWVGWRLHRPTLE
ncbi:hypothetical protein ACFSGX_17105 [Sphingomonas arantia]|uniref:Metal-dependent hydrolase n=1 Tax=Sphingomonas arantia TaxID=1460676 RepID=A0ABW4U156_9SPHN